MGFLELATDGPLAPDVASAIDGADYVFTSREVVAETFNALSRIRRRNSDGLAWWESIRASGIRVFEPPLEEIHGMMTQAQRTGGLSLTDFSLALVAKQQRAASIVTGDAEFRRLGLEPLFAKR